MKPTHLKIIIELSIVIGFLLIAVLVFDLKERYSPEEKPFLYTSQHTIASCNDNFCIDLLIDCNSSGHVTNIIPITDLIYMGDDWVDLREVVRWC